MNQPEPVSILAGFAGVAIVLIALSAWGARRRVGFRPSPFWLGVWEEVSRRLGGKLYVTESGDFRVRFRFRHGRDATLSQSSRMSFEIQGGEFGKLRIELKPAIPGKGFELDDLRHVGRTPEARQLAASFLTPPVRRVLEDLIEVAGRAEVTIGKTFRVTGHPTKDAKSLVRFTMLSLQLAQHATLFALKDEGVRVVESGTSSTGECQICGAALEGTLVRCTRCSTPHHADCWDYAQVCSTYGCGERTFVA